MKKTILVFIGHYLPGYKSGGPVRTISNMLDLLGKEFNFWIITRDRDSLDNKPYENIKVNEWNDGPNCKIFYMANNFSLFTNYKLVRHLFGGSLITVIKSIEFDQYYLNSLLDVNFSTKIILLWKLKLLPQKPILLAPRGELMEGALSIKPLKKRIFLSITKLLNLYKNIIWHASSEYEAVDIKREFGSNEKIKIALDVPNYNLKSDYVRTHLKEKGKLKILFISTIVPKKNLKFAIEVLNKVEGNFIIDIYGPIKDQKYWKECLNAIDGKIKNKVSYIGIIPNDRIHEIYPNYNLFFFPTLGENYGHVIYESLFYGCPVLCTAGKTPWDKLDSFNAGWNLNILKPKKFVEQIEKLIEFNSPDYQNIIRGCNSYLNYFKKDNIVNTNIELFT
ncbi:MAG: glycosyltransferase [Ignavibacteriae bacterium]|nr:glycosyltransferase [Ignavibacteriota bacterium]